MTPSGPGPFTAQWPSKDWLAEKFPGGAWGREGADVFALRWCAYADSWEALLSAWEDDVFTITRVCGRERRSRSLGWRRASCKMLLLHGCLASLSRADRHDRRAGVRRPGILHAVCVIWASRHLHDESL